MTVTGDAADSSRAEQVIEELAQRPLRELLRDLHASALELRARVHERFEDLFDTSRLTEIVSLWFGPPGTPGRPRTYGQLIRRLNRDVAVIDEILGEQVDAILHHPRFQRLESSWRGIEYLVLQAAAVAESDRRTVKVRVLDVSWKEVVRDLERAIEFDQSHLFKAIYEAEFGIAGGEPYGVLLGDYEVSHRPRPGQRTNDVDGLRGMASVAAAAFAPFVTGAHPSVLGLDSFRDLELPMDLARTFQQLDYTRWNALRKHADSRFIGLTLPRVLMRLPYADDGSRRDGFRYRERVEGPNHSRYLWGRAIWAFGSVLIRAFSESGWLANIRGAPNDAGEGGVVPGLAVHCFATDLDGLAPKFSTDVLITDQLEKAIGDLGFIPLCRCKYTSLTAFYGSSSLQIPETYDTEIATANARLSSMLQYILCVSRFAHYVKVMGRDKVGSLATAMEVREFLYRWLRQYCNPARVDDLESRARYPLREADVQVREHPGKPGSYMCVVHLQPQFQLDQVVSAVKLVTELAPVGTGR